MKKLSKGYSEEEDDDGSDLQIDKIEKTYVLLDNHWKALDTNLKKKLPVLIRFIATYRNKNIHKLETPYPVDYPAWVPACTKVLYDVTGIDKDAFEKDVLTIRGWEGYIDTELKDKAPYILMNMIIRWLLKNKKEREAAMVMYYIGYGNYWSVFTAIFKVYKPKLEVMKYTINEMSYRSGIKQAGSVDKWLYESVRSTFETYEKRLMRGSDWELHYINEKIRGKLKSAMKTIYRAQEANEKAGKYIFTSKNVVDDVIIDNTYGVAEILSIAETYTSKFFAEPVDEETLATAIGDTGISARDLRNTLVLIADDKSNQSDVKKMYQSMFHIFLEVGKYNARDIGSARFYYEMQKLYKPGHATDPNRVFIKDVMDKWLNAGSKTYRTTNRTGTIGYFRKAIYDYFVLKVMKDK